MVQINTVVAVIGGRGAGSAAGRRSGRGEAAAGGRTGDGSTGRGAAFAGIAARACGGRRAGACDCRRAVRSSPLVRRMAREHHLDLTRIPGTGSEGRITKEDVLRYMEQRAGAAPTADRVPRLRLR